MIIEFQDQMHSKFNMKTLGEVSYALGIKIHIENNMVQLSQELYMHDIIARSGIKDMKPALSPMITSPKLHKKRDEEEPCSKDFKYRAHIGSLMYASVGTRPDIAYSTSQVSRFLDNPSVEHQQAVKRLPAESRTGSGIVT